MKILSLGNIQVYQFELYPVQSNMFLICKGSNAIVVDPHYSLKALEILESNTVDNITILLTHEHPDHTSGVNFFKSNFKASLVCNDICAIKIAKKRNNAPLVILMQLTEIDKKSGTKLAQEYKKNNPPYSCFADVTFNKEKKIDWYGCPILLTSAPGHSPGSVAIEFNNQLLFTGDYLIKNTPIITRFKDSSNYDLNNITIPYFEKVNKGLLILPGHGEIYSFKDIEGDPLKWLRI
ncbi:MBL fold metallo-hydrolase [Vibrio tapetis subsp. quintayensis]|uniref:MBL fold metallo-hydrolase n=1 Tax=Vibrio tapetis TaxID=52443 RepID=UPI0025B2988B|nr:MBL fold metallo-hydrolase [Vibrio tapetis]MDN3679459.1 MBL fold metallo-hydrolase [Vibrio tapetis subsp. quintayensis]